MLRRAASVFPFVLATLVAPLCAQFPSLEQATRVFDCTAGADTTLSAMFDEVAKKDVVFLGETHVDDVTHQVEQRVLQELLRRRQGRVVLSMEMFERDVQGAVDDYLAGRIDEATFRERARPWDNYDEAFRPLIEIAKAAKIPVVAANFPSPLRRVFAMGGGAEALAKLKPEQRALIPAEIFPASDAYWERVDRAVRGHMGGGGGGTAEERLYDTQNLWDNSMGDAVAQALVQHPDRLVLHIAGGFHVAWHDGTVAQFVRRAPGRSCAVVSVLGASELHLARPERDRAQADWLVYSRTLARNFHDGNHAVEVPAELRYRLELPAQGENWPLLVWLPDRTTRTDDAMATWRALVGEQAAVVVVEAPFPELQPDLALGGRYAFGDGYRADYSRVASGLTAIVEYVTRRGGADAKRVVIAGAGDGGAVVLWASLYGEWLAADYVAIEPNDLKRLGMEALPDLQPVAKSLHLLAADPEDARLQKVVADYGKVGLTTTIAALHTTDVAAGIGARLGLPASPAVAGDAVRSLQLVVDTARAREWQQLHVASLRRRGVAAVALAPGAAAGTGETMLLTVGGDGPWPAKSFASGAGIPLAGGPFGGTTIVVLPKGTSEADKLVWFEHEQKKVLKRRSMFANIAVACADGEPSLATVLTKLKGMGRSRALIVPAAFCVDAATMQALRAAAGDAGDGMDLAWLPGLGAELATEAGHGR